MSDATLTSATPGIDTTVPMTGGRAAISTLEQLGVDTVFGIPGVHTLAFYDALRDSSIRHILARHEQGAGFMADGYARASGRPGVAIIITGPGVTNVATAIGEAYTDSSPVLVLSSNNPSAYVDRMRGCLHDLKDQLGVTAAVTKWNARVDDANDVASTVAEAYGRAKSGRPRPVHVEVLLDALDAPASTPVAQAVAEPAPVVPDAALLDLAATRLGQLGKVVIYCGGGAMDAGSDILALAERLGAPVLTSTMGKASVPEDHPLVLGALWRPDNAVDELVRDADALVVFGSKLGEQATSRFRFPLPAEIIRIDVDEEELTRNATPTIGIVGDAALSAAGLVDRLARINHEKTGYDRSAIDSARQQARASAFGAGRLPYLEALRRAIPRDGILVNDMTMMSYAACDLYPAYEPRTFLSPYGYGTLGFSLPAAIGAKAAQPEQAVVSVCGDGGFQFTMAEIATARQHRLGIPVVIFNDHCYSAVKDAQSEGRGGRFIAVDLENPDFIALADAYRLPSVRAMDPKALENAVVDALDRDVPTIVEVPITQWV